MPAFPAHNQSSTSSHRRVVSSPENSQLRESESFGK